MGVPGTIQADQLFALFGKKRRRRAGPSSAALRAFGVSPASSLSKLVDYLSKYEASELGALCLFSTKDWIPKKTNALSFLLEQPFRVDAGLAHCVPIGTTGSGDIWLVSLEARGGRNDVFLYHHDTGAFARVADSLQALLQANQVVERDERPSAAEKKALTGRVWSSNDFELPWSARPKTGPSLTKTLLERTKDLRSVLNGYSKQVPSAARLLPSRPLPAEIIEALLRSYLRGDEAALTGLLERFRRGSDGLVKDTVLILEGLAKQGGKSTLERRLARLVGKRSAKKRATPAREPEPDDDDRFDYIKIVAEEAQQLGRHEKAVREFRKALELRPKDGATWTALCWSLSCLALYKEMVAAAARAIEGSPRSSYAHQQLAVAYVGLEDWARVIPPARRAIELDKKNAYALFALATALVMQGKAEARVLFERAAKLAPDLGKALKGDAALKRALGQLG